MGGVFVDLLAAERGAAGNAQRGDAAAVFAGGVGEDLEAAVLDQFGHVNEFERVAQVGLVGTEAAHGLGPCQAREAGVELDVDHFLEDLADHAFHRVLHVLLGHPGELHVELGEFELAVGTQGFVAEAARDLVVAVEAGHHQDLLEQLRRLRQRVELARVHSRRHQEVARALGRGLGEDGRFDVLETTRVQPAAQRLHQLDAGAHHLLHFRAAQVEVAVLEADVLAGVFMRVERQRLGLVQHFDGGGHDFDLAGADAVVDRMAGAHGAGDAQAILVTDGGGGLHHRGVAFGPGGFGHHLDDAFVVAQVDETHATQVAGDIGPAAKGDGLADHGLVHEAAEMAAHAGSGNHGAGAGIRPRKSP